MPGSSVGIRILACIVYGHEVEDPLPESRVGTSTQSSDQAVLGALVVAAGIAVVATAAALTELDPMFNL